MVISAHQWLRFEFALKDFYPDTLWKNYIKLQVKFTIACPDENENL
jgi:hypothetical protein